MAPHISSGITTALIYTRVSKDDQAREGISLDAQLAECRRHASQHGWLLGSEYQDVLTGTRDDRPMYQALLSDVRRLRAERVPVAVVVARLDRFGRRLLERVRCREELKSLGVPVHSVREGGEVSDLVANILASVAQEEVRLLGERVREVRRHIANSGWRPVGSCPWGYTWRVATADERRLGAPHSVLEIDPDTAPYVRKAFEMVAAGESVRGALRWIAALPSTARGGRVMSHTGARKFFRMPVYADRRERSDGGDVLTDPPQRWPQLIDDATWGEVQRRLRDHARIPRQASGQYLLTGLIRCPLCGERMCAWQTRRRSARYRCERDGRGCYGTAMLGQVDAAVQAEVGAVVAAVASADSGLWSALQREWRALQQPTGDVAQPAQTVQALERETARARRRLTDAAVKLVDGEIDKEGYELLRDKAKADLEAAESELAQLRGAEAAPVLPPLDDVLREAGGWLAALLDADMPAKREVLGVLIDTVVPVRLGLGRYTARITWAPLGDALRQAANMAAEAA